MNSFSRTIEITVLSAENLRLNGKSVKKNAFVVVKTDPLTFKSTGADHEGGSNPKWNQKLELEMGSNCRFVTLQVECRIGSGNRVVGSAAVPVSDFVGGYYPDNYLHLLSYRLRDVRGVKNGIINVSVKVKGGLADYVLPAGYNTGSSSSLYCSEAKWGTAVQGNMYGGGVVTGVPVWLEITILSAENLSLNGKLVKKNACVVVKTSPCISKLTRADHEEGSNPIWNQKLEMEMASNCRFITLQVESRTASGNKVIGAASIPLSDFAGGYFPANYLHFLSNRLRVARGEKNGIINVSIRVKGLADFLFPVVRKNSPAGYTAASSSCLESTRRTSAKGNNGCHGGVVTGVPVWCGAPAGT